MGQALRLATWPKPSNCQYALKPIEIVLLSELQPPLNLQNVVTPWTARLKAARNVMADEARIRGEERI
jgi:hypothetical protein